MITRIKIDGFKSLLNTDLHLGSFTCIAGANAVGKSNFFDAIIFLSKLADTTILDAAKSIRSESQKHANIKDMFFKNGNEYYKKMRFEVDMIVQQNAEDELGQQAEATTTSLKYTLELKLNSEQSQGEFIEIVKECLEPNKIKETKEAIFFETDKTWLDSVLKSKKAQTPFISTANEKIKLHQDGGRGRSSEFIPQKMSRTLLSTVKAESPTALTARQEMRSWQMLQFEPNELRQPSTIHDVRNAEITASGKNLPATLYRLHTDKQPADIYQRIANKLTDLVSGVDEIDIDRDEKRDLLTLQLKFKNGLILPAQSLSDGTLRFLGLAIINEDTKSSGLICLEEPENGINPKKMKIIIDLLKEMATNTKFEVNADDNPLRQVIINSHSPLVVRCVPDESLYLAVEKEIWSDTFNRKIKHTAFLALEDTWKTIKNKKTQEALFESITLGEIYHYLGEESHQTAPTDDDNDRTKTKTVRQNIAASMKKAAIEKTHEPLFK